MLNVKKILSRKTITNVVGSGVGYVAAEVVTNKFASKIFKTENAMKASGALPVVAGVVLDDMGSRSPIVKSIGAGMVAYGAGSLIKAFLPAETKANLGVGGYDTMIQGIDTMMGNVPSDDYTSSSYDYTSGSAGELNY